MNEEKRERCRARTSRGNPCQRYPILGGAVCQSHGGAAPHVKRKAAERLETERALRQLEIWGIPVGAKVNALDAIQEEVTRCAYHVRQLEQALLVSDPDAHLVATSTTAREGGGEHGEWLDTTIEARPSVLLSLYDEERDRLVRVCVGAIKVGMAEHHVRIVEEQAQMMVDAVRLALSFPWLTTGQREAIAAEVGRQLAQLVGIARDEVVDASAKRKRLTTGD